MRIFAQVIGAVIGGGTAFLLLAGERISDHIRNHRTHKREQ